MDDADMQEDILNLIIFLILEIIDLIKHHSYQQVMLLGVSDNVGVHFMAS